MPVAIPNAHAAVEEALNRLDPRARVETSHHAGVTRYTVRPRETIDFKVHVPESSAPVWREGMRGLLEHGRAARLPASGLRVTGSALLERFFGELARGDGELRLSPPPRDAVMKVLLRNPESGESEPFDDFAGNVTGGIKSVTFTGAACAGALGLSLSFAAQGESVERSLSVSHDFGGWADRDVMRIPHFDKVRRITERLRSGWTLRFALEIDGEEAASGSATPLRDFMPEQAGMLEHIGRLRSISEILGAPIRFIAGASVSRREFDGAIEVLETAEGRWVFGEAQLSEPPRATVTALGGNIAKILAEPGSTSIAFVETGGSFLAFGARLPLPKRLTRIENFRAELAQAIDIGSIPDGVGVEMILLPIDGFRLSMTYPKPEEMPEGFEESGALSGWRGEQPGDSSTP